MVKFTATIEKFGNQGEKTGWTYIEIPEDIAQALKPGNKKAFRVKGKLDQYAIAGVAIMPMGNGRFVMPLNAAMRRGIRKKQGGMLAVQISADTNPLQPPQAFLDCLEDEPKAKTFFFEQLKPSHRNYYIKWMGGVKTEAAVARRIAQVINALVKEYDFVQMVRSEKTQKK